MMKRQTFKLVSAALLGVAVLASCQDYTPDEQAIVKKKTVEDYVKAFNAEFPNIDPEQNWGFGPMPICGEDVDITRGMNTNSNEWESVYHYEVPGGLTNPQNPIWGWAAGDVSNYERAYVYWWFSTHQYPEPIEVSWTEFFIENVWGQPEHSNVTGDLHASPYKGAIESGMDNLHILDIGKTHSNSPIDNKIVDEATALQHGVNQVSDDYEHINDFNSAGGAKEQVMYAYDVLSEDWFYRESRGGNLADHNNWTVRYINGNYYLGFDYWCQKKNGDDYAQDEYSVIKPDGYYNDWIIKLSSGKHIVDSYTRRIMCEDLGNTFDWDFNDLVFDVTIYNGEYGNGQSGYFAQITLQAAGGTLPIYIGQKDDAHEAHALFGVPVTTPVNVDAVGGVNRAAVVFHLPLDDTYTITEQDVVINGQTKRVMSFDPNQIPIIVDRSADLGVNNKVADDYKLTAIKGEAPQKFACPCDTYWMKEFKNVEGIEGKQPAGHPNFAKWVGGTITNEDDAFITERTKELGNFTVLYADANGSPFSVSFSEDGNVGTIQPWKDLWNSTFNDPSNAQFTEVRSYPKVVDTDGTPMTGRDGYTTYSTTFQAQAPYIYQTVGQDDDPTAYTAKNMDRIVPQYANQRVVWSPEAKKVELEVNDQGKGYVLGSGYYHKGASFDITAVPRPGQLFRRWVEVPGERLISDQSTFQISNLERDLKYKAIFEENPNPPYYHVYFACDPVGAGYIQNKQGQTDLGEYKEGAKVQFVAMNNRGYMFSHWEDGSDNETRELTITGETTITATYDASIAYNITVRSNNDSWGTVSIRKQDWSVQGNGVYYEWEPLVITATGKDGHQFVKWESSVNPEWNPYGGSSITIYPEDEFGYEPPSEIILTAIFQQFP